MPKLTKKEKSNERKDARAIGYESGWTDAAKEFWEYYSSKVKETTAKNAFSSFQKHCVKPFEKFTLVQMLKSNNLH